MIVFCFIDRKLLENRKLFVRSYSIYYLSAPLVGGTR